MSAQKYWNVCSKSKLETTILPTTKLFNFFCFFYLLIISKTDHCKKTSLQFYENQKIFK